MHELIAHVLSDAWPDGFVRYLYSTGGRYLGCLYVPSSTLKVNREFGCVDICGAYPLDISIS
jgi:hypothetical protein